MRVKHSFYLAVFIVILVIVCWDLWARYSFRYDKKRIGLLAVKKLSTLGVAPGYELRVLDSDYEANVDDDGTIRFEVIHVNDEEGPGHFNEESKFDIKFKLVTEDCDDMNFECIKI